MKNSIIFMKLIIQSENDIENNRTSTIDEVFNKINKKFEKNNMNYSVIWAESAESDLNEIIDYILDKEEYNKALKIYEKIKSRMNLLKVSPEQGRVVPELQILRIKKYREIIDTPWRIIYKIGKEKLYILLVIDGRRNIEEILFDRLSRINEDRD